MKKLYIVRHAKSSKDDIYKKDFDRPLNARGIKDTAFMGDKLKKRKVVVDFFLSSPALRALTTCKEFANILGYVPEKIKTDERIYLASSETLFSILSQLENQSTSIMIFGHNPGFTDFAGILLNNPSIRMPTCGIVSTQLDIKSWHDIRPGCGKMEFFDAP